VDALHPRLLVTDFPGTFAFYAAVLPKLVGAELAGGGPAGPYASWDVGGEGLLSMFDATAMSTVTGTEASKAAREADKAAGDAVMLVCRVGDVDAGTELCRAHGAAIVAPPVDRPEWGKNLRTSHVRAPEGVLIELQSY
jgi:predicted enzyme related to lactoylglutathione lyase